MFLNFFASSERVKSRYLAYKPKSKQNSLINLLSNNNYEFPDMAWGQIWSSPGSALQRQLLEDLSASDRKKTYFCLVVEKDVIGMGFCIIATLNEKDEDRKTAYKGTF